MQQILCAEVALHYHVFMPLHCNPTTQILPYSALNFSIGLIDDYASISKYKVILKDTIFVSMKSDASNVKLQLL